MRTLSVVFSLLFLAAVLAAQAPATKGGQTPAAKGGQTPAKAPATSPRPAPLSQVMRGILFPNSNLIFDVQQHDPGAPKKESGTGAPGGSTTETFANVYAGWPMVQAAAASLEEAADIILKPRLCENGKPAPIMNADYKKAAANLKVVARNARAAADRKDKEKLEDIANDLADACSACHEVYRDAADATSGDRCVAKKKAGTF